MANLIAVMGESGSGKTTSMRNLDPSTTFYIDCDKKGLSWRGWKSQYNKEKKNYHKTNDPETVEKLLDKIDKEQLQIRTIVIDTGNGIMVGDEMRRSKEKGYDKWMDLAAAIWNLIDKCLEARDDLTVIWCFHAQVEKDDNGNSWARIQTNGKKLNKIVLESKFPLVLYAKCIDGKYIFETQAKNSTAKSPMGLLEETIDNDLATVIAKIEEYEKG